MISKEDANTIKEMSARATRMAESALSATSDRDYIIREAYLEGATVMELTKLTGLTRQRIYQIKAARKTVTPST